MDAPLGEKAERQGAVQASLQSLSTHIAKLEGTIQALAKRLAPILSDDVPRGQEAEGKDKNGVPLSRDIDGYTYRVNEVTKQLQDICSRLEI